MGDMSEHNLSFRNDEFAFDLKATMDDETWQRIVRAVMETLVSPTAIISLPQTMTDAEQKDWAWRWRQPH